MPSGSAASGLVKFKISRSTLPAEALVTVPSPCAILGAR